MSFRKQANSRSKGQNVKIALNKMLIQGDEADITVDLDTSDMWT
jgi:hypothetical protein